MTTAAVAREVGEEEVVEQRGGRWEGIIWRGCGELSKRAGTLTAGASQEGALTEGALGEGALPLIASSSFSHLKTLL